MILSCKPKVHWQETFQELQALEDRAERIKMMVQGESVEKNDQWLIKMAASEILGHAESIRQDLWNLLAEKEEKNNGALA